MKETLKAFGKMINMRQILIGLSILLLGTLVYIVDRPPYQTYFVYKSFINISLHDALPSLFGFIGYSLPSFIHVFSLILITAGFLSCQKRGCIVICLCWFFVDITFELGQKCDVVISKIIPSWFTRIPFLENTENYFLFGTLAFDDIAAIIIGSVMAYFVLLHTIQEVKEP